MAHLEGFEPPTPSSEVRFNGFGAICRSGRRWTQTQAADVLGIDQPKVSALMQGRLTGFSIDRLLRFLLALDRDVEIVIKPNSARSRRGRVSVVTGP